MERKRRGNGRTTKTERKPKKGLNPDGETTTQTKTKGWNKSGDGLQTGEAAKIEEEVGIR